MGVAWSGWLSANWIHSMWWGDALIPQGASMLTRTRCKGPRFMRLRLSCIMELDHVGGLDPGLGACVC